ncbi:PPC domain-containing DNA-binding protein [Granulicella arctica]|jgi:uncharacterized protein|uniref:PPC domain-containing DNA-binding protein n=1 Tax=Granulicella arctica TaxID=940613 RepID=UPI0021E001A2|nr:PPC domain-containing DNA-binding protein [Granulicella arctica]
MKFKKIEGSLAIYVLIFNSGDEVRAGLKHFALGNGISGASFKAVGALSSVKLAWYNPETKAYDTSVDLHEQVELLSLLGYIAIYEEKPALHAHVVVALRDGSTRGGHLLEAIVHPTCELFLQEAPAHLRRRLDAQSRLLLIAI